MEELAVSTLFGLLVWRGRLFRSSFINVVLVVWMGPLLYLVWVGGLEGSAFSNWFELLVWRGRLFHLVCVDAFPLSLGWSTVGGCNVI